MLKTNKAITLISLIITIIVLLIIAGVTINLVLGDNGLFNKAKTSVAKHENVQEGENSVLEQYEKEIDKYIDIIELPQNDGLIGQLYKISKSGYSKITINGKNREGIEESVEYKIHSIVHNGTLRLDGTKIIEGMTLADNVYSVGDSTTDVATSSSYAEYTVVLKIEGDLIIDEGITLTACKSTDGYGGPKGMIIICKGKIENNGTISMTARGAKAFGQNVYLWKNLDGKFEYVPAIGANGGLSISTSIPDTYGGGNSGENGIMRQTGGGGSGGIGTGDGTPTSISGAGSSGTSYSGGTGGGGAHYNNYGGTITGGDGESNGGAGGYGSASNPSSWATRYARWRRRKSRRIWRLHR